MNVKLGIRNTQVILVVGEGVVYTGTAIPWCNLIIQVIFVYNDNHRGFKLVALP